MNKKRSVLNILTDISGKIITLIIGIVLPKLYIDSFGSEINGLLSSINNLLVYINLLEAGVGGASTQALYKAISEKQQGNINSILSATDKFYRRTGIYFFSIVCIISFLYPIFVKSEIGFGTVTILILLSAVPSAIKYFFQGKYTILLNADNRAYVLNTITVISNISINISKIVLIILGFDVIAVQISFAVISFLQMLFIAIFVRKHYGELDLTVEPDMQAISKKKYVMIHTVSSTVFSNIDILVLTLLTNLKVVSIYTIYNMIFNQINQIIKSMSNGMNASFGQLYYLNKSKFKKEYTLFAIGYRYITLTLLTIAGNMILPFMRIYAGSFQDANYVDYILPIMFLSTNILDAIRWPEVLGINTTGSFQETAPAAIIETTINLVCSIIFVNKMGIYGVLLATIVALLYRTIDMIRFVNINIVEQGVIKDIVYVILTWFVSIGVVLISYKVIPSVNSYFEWICLAMPVGIGCGLLHLVISILFYYKFYNSLVRVIKDQFKKLEEVFSNIILF